jgi:CubicO group peptidase (beta-lactamase class C family)
MSSGLSRHLTYEVEPNKKWFYNTPAYSRLFDVLTEVSGLKPNEYTDAWLTTPLGMPDTHWALRDGGLNRYGLVTTARDLARMGLLMLTQGVWHSQRLISEEVIGSASESSQPLNPAYGLLWWVNGEQSWDDWTNTGMRAGSFIPTAPNDLIAARGIGDRKIYVLPSRGLVVTRLGGFAMHDESGEPQRRFFDQEFWRLLMGALPAAR